MKISDFILRYHTNYKNDGICRIRVFIRKDNACYVVVTDIERNPSTSAFNALPYIKQELISKGYLLAEADYILHDETARFTSFEWVGKDVMNPNEWHSIKLSQITKLLNCAEDEFQNRTQTNASLWHEVLRITNQIDPFYDYPYPANPEVVKRRIEILDKQVRKSELKKLVEKNAGEHELQALIEKDLSLLAELLALPPEEYICFTQFPVGDGRVDFAVFSSRSWMSVTLVEIKGADFPLCTRTGEIKLSYNAEKAYRQLERRQRYIYNNYSNFSKQMHEIRIAVENGTPMYNALLGPRGKLLVDEDKQVKLYYLMIAGRTSNDLVESEIRHTREQNGLPNIRIESWDTFLNKLQRP